MKRQSQAGFAVVELALVVVILAAVGGVGYYIWHSHKASNVTTTATTTTTGNSKYQSPTTSVPAAPQVNSASDLNSAMTALNQTNVSSSNADSSQLGTEASGF